MNDILLNFFKELPPQWLVFVIAALPVSELRGAIPAGIMMNLPFWEVFFFAVAGNLLPIIPLLYLLDPVSRKLRKTKAGEKFFSWLFDHARKKSEVIEKYEFWGLLIFVAIPLPMTGAWTGAIAASLLGLNKKLSFIAILAGVFIAAVAVSLFTLGVKGCFTNV